MKSEKKSRGFWTNEKRRWITMRQRTLMMQLTASKFTDWQHRRRLCCSEASLLQPLVGLDRHFFVFNLSVAHNVKALVRSWQHSSSALQCPHVALSCNTLSIVYIPGCSQVVHLCNSHQQLTWRTLRSRAFISVHHNCIVWLNFWAEADHSQVSEVLPLCESLLVCPICQQMDHVMAPYMYKSSVFHCPWAAPTLITPADIYYFNIL